MISADYREFVWWHVESQDIDPVYPVLQSLHDVLCDSPQEKVALTTLYVAYYNLASAVATWLDGWRPGDAMTDAQLRRPTGTERRAHRDVRQFAKHIESLGDYSHRFASLHDYFKPQLRVTGPTADGARWEILQQRLTSIHGNGRWAAYKEGEILDTVHGWDCPPPDAGHANSSGPRKGLADIFPDAANLTGNHPSTIRALDYLTSKLVDELGIPVAQVETTLCDWHSVLNGNYYVGHDIDLMQEQSARCDRAKAYELIREARRDRLGVGFLGEVGGWRGVRKHLNRLYRDEGRIDWWT